MNVIEEYGTKSQYVEEVAAYIRVSTQEQKLHGISIEAQEQKLKEYAEKNNMKIVGWYRDEGVSGRKLIKNRPELQRMIQDAEQKKFKRIIFIKLDRFFRSVAEYHECMKRLQTGGVIWTATEEKYDLSTASGEAFVNMKLTMAQFEADQTGERIRMVNEYKIQTGQPLYGSGSLPFCYQVKEPDDGERHKYIAKRDEEIMYDVIDQVRKKRSVRAAVLYVNKKYNRTLNYNSVMRTLGNELIYGSYKGNPNYCEPYITKEEFLELQSIIKRTPRTSNTEYTYILTGLIKCPHCGRRLAGCLISSNRGKYKWRYRGYRCNAANTTRVCVFKTVAFEKRMEAELLNAIEGIVERKRLKVFDIQKENTHVGQYDLEALQQELNRLNYSWQKGRIKSVEEYDKRYDELMVQIDAANSEMTALHDEPDYERIQQVISGDWRKLYAELDAEHKRAFWRSFVEEIQIEWTKETKRVIDVKFF